MSRQSIFLKSANVVAFLLVIVVNYIVFKNDESKQPDTEPGDNNTLSFVNDKVTFPETHLLPAEYTFKIWPFIYTLLGGFILYQWTDAADAVTVEGIQYYHVIASILNVTWLLTWRNKSLVLLDAFVLVALFLVTFKAYNNITEYYPPKVIWDRLFIHYPFTIYAAWTLVATILNFWVAISILDTVFLSTVAIAFLGAVGIYFSDYHKRNDAMFASTIAWALVGIANKHQDTMPILIASSVASGLILGGVLRVFERRTIAWWNLRRNRLYPENEPLLV
ncbi:19838_t:CDS:2 [Funneliformis geosporum]|uniref:6657_t:CDS:1 n=1 Tax=Funneliformis geosporum TaxID=1117311 RepID=A0A9W4SQA8_9GLOM|nr:19838_t:CDS:2 [Funneliformis geosporum]CAI2178802.1 6657_t:CDS:2 [Funneliformis geosporum]